MDDEIRFYRASGEYGWLSNLFACTVKFEDRLFASSEHAYQYGKPVNNIVADWMVQAPSASLVAQVAHALFPWQVTADWNDTKVDRMRSVLRAKFEQNQFLADRLIETGFRNLIEDSKFDAFWGVGKKGTGKNMLGVLLMELRWNIRRD